MICRAGAKGRALDRLGIDFISVFGMPPVAFVALAADLGCRHISLAPQPITSNPHGYPHWSLLEDAALRRDVAAALRDHDVSVSLGEGFLVRPGVDIPDSGAPLFDVMEELGVKRVNVASIEQDVRPAGRAAPASGGGTGDTDAGQGARGLWPQGTPSALYRSGPRPARPGGRRDVGSANLTRFGGGAPWPRPAIHI